MKTKWNIKLVREFVLKNGNGDILLSDNYINAREKLLFLCFRCKEEYSVVWYGFINGTRCKECSIKERGLESRLKYNDIKEMFEKEKYILISAEYVNSKQKMDVICPQGHSCKMSRDSFLVGDRCRTCYIINKTFSYEFIKESFEKLEYVLLSSEYNGYQEPLKVICKNGHETSITWNKFQSGEGCKFCFYENHKLKYDFVKDEIESEEYILESKEYSLSCEKLKMICPRGHKINLSYANFRNGIRCSVCCLSKAEQAIEKYLKKNNYIYKHQFKFSDCRDKNALPFDFMIKINNEIVICEANGQQHYEIVEHWGGEKKYLDQIKKDKIKRDYCKNKGIKVIDIPYWEFNNIEKILDEALSSQGKED